MAVRRVRDDKGNTFFVRSYTDGEGNQQWARDDNLNKIQSLSSDALNTYRTKEELSNEEVDYLKELDKRGDISKVRAYYTKTMPFMTRMSLAGQRETKKLLAGGGDLIDYAKAIGSGVLGMEDSEMNAFKSIADRRKEQEEFDNQYREFDENSGAAGTIGKMLPYILGERLVGPLASKLSKGITTPIQKGLEATTDEGRSILKALNTPMNIKEPFTETLKAAVKNFKTPKIGRPVLANPYRAGMLDDIIGGTMLGAAEGGLHYDNSAQDGALAGLFGGIAGNAVRTPLTRAPIMWNQTGKDLLKWYDEQGARLTPGLKTGSGSLQKFEHALRASDDWTDSLKRYDTANDIVDNRILKKSIGLNSGDIDNFSPEILRAHKQKLKAELDDFEASSTAAFEASDIMKASQAAKHAQDNLDALKNKSAPEDRRAAKMAAQYMMRLRTKYNRVLDPNTGQFDHAKMKGKDFKEIYGYLKADISKAYKDGDLRTANALKPIREAMDTALDKGVDRYNGPSAAKFRDLRERYAITQMVTENGLTPLGTFDPKRFRAHLVRDDIERMLTESGSPRMNDLYKLSKIGQMKDMQLGSDLSGLGMVGFENKHKQSMVQKFLSSPSKLVTPLKPEAMMNLYLAGYPSTTGWLNMSGKNFGNPAMYTRAAAQSTQVHPKIINGVLSLKDMIDKIINNDDRK